MSLFEILLSCEPLGPCVVLTLEGAEAMHELPRWIVVVQGDGDVDPAALAGQAATLNLIDPEEETVREIALVVTRAASERRRGSEKIYHLELSDPLWLLTQRAGYKIFQGKTTETIVKEILAAAAPKTKIESHLSGGYVTWPQRVQYGEVEWSFIARLLADDGISHWFDTVGGVPTFVMGDSFGAHAPIPKRPNGDGDVPIIPFVGPDGTRSGARRNFTALEWEENVAHQSVWVREFDIAQPDVYIDGKAGDGPRHYFEFPARVPDKKAADDRAERRLEQLRRDEVVVRGACDCIRLRPGRKLKVGGDGVQLFGTFAMFEQEMAVASLAHRYARPTRGHQGTPYHARVTLRPSKGADDKPRPPHRPAIVPPVRSDAFESAVITGAGGEEIHVDEYGRVKLRFFWDRSGIGDDKSSYWARTLQKPISAPMFLPRVGWESVVGYFDGVPDHPFVLGRVYNGTAPVPYSLPAKSASTGLQSSSSPGGGGAHEIRMSDDAGAEEFAVHATKDHSEKIGNNANTRVGANDDHAIGKSLVRAVGGLHALTVGASQEIGVGQECIINVDGANTEVIGAGETINVKGNRAVNAGACYIELIGAFYGVQCNQSNTMVRGGAMRLVISRMTVGAGIGFSESVAAVRVYVTDTRVVTTKMAYSEGVTGGRKSNVGATKINAGSKYGTKATGAKISAGATTVSAGPKVSITAKIIDIKCSSLLAATLEVSGSNVQAKGGTTEIDGNTTRNAGGEVGG